MKLLQLLKSNTTLRQSSRVIKTSLNPKETIATYVSRLLQSAYGLQQLQL
jgi:hypothetical protein